MNKEYLKLMLITSLSATSSKDYLKFIIKAVEGGVTSVQLRGKDTPLQQQIDLGIRLLELLKPFNVPLFINDYAELAIAIGADGLHIGQEDMHPDQARTLLGPDKLIGFSIDTLEELEEANCCDSLDYVAAGSIFPSKSKHDCKNYWGIEGLKNFTSISKHPVIAIGGVDLTNVQEVIQAGADGVAIINAIHEAEDPKIVSQQIRNVINLNLQGQNIC